MVRTNALYLTFSEYSPISVSDSVLSSSSDLYHVSGSYKDSIFSFPIFPDHDCLIIHLDALVHIYLVETPMIES